MKRLGNLLAFIAALVAVLLGFFYLDGVRNVMSQLNERILDVVLSSSSWTFAIVARPILHTVLMLVEAFIATLILAALIRTLFGGRKWASLMTTEALRYLSMVAALLASPLFAAHAFSILWGDVSFRGDVLIKFYDPDKLSFTAGVGLGLVAVWYLAIDLFPFIFRPSVGTFWPVSTIVSSITPVIVVVCAIGNYWFGAYPLTTYKLAAMQVWGPIALIDLSIISMHAWLLKRSLFGVEEAAGIH